MILPGGVQEIIESTVSRFVSDVHNYFVKRGNVKTWQIAEKRKLQWPGQQRKVVLKQTK
jgi:hypothetical protein